MIRRRWWIVVTDTAYGRGVLPSVVEHEYIDGPFLFRWSAEAAANIYRADEAQRARYDHRAMRKIAVIKHSSPESRTQ